MLVSNLWGGRDKDLAGGSEMYSDAVIYVHVLYVADMLAGLSGEQIRTSMAAVVPAIEERVHKLSSAAASITLVKDATLFGRVVATGSQIHSLPTAATIL